ECWPVTPEVAGSSPVRSANFKSPRHTPGAFSLVFARKRAGRAGAAFGPCGEAGYTAGLANQAL
ncbi:hypothetical protein, partial [Stenotrophomonas maltophilia]|uniref:hypothetical protein n=1 Tax=Stenotrophomonas maltophilia TaxID=40324 RepID=UPI0039C09FD1